MPGDGIPSADHIISEYQSLKVGSRIPFDAVGVSGGGPVGERHLGMGLYEDDSQHTRLVSRLRVSYKWARPSIVPMLLTDAVELVMM